MTRKPILSDTITVCKNCSKASCWHGLFLCDSEYPNTKEITIEDALKLGYEHPEYILNAWSPSTCGCDVKGHIVLHKTIPNYEDMEFEELRERLLLVLREEGN